MVTSLLFNFFFYCRTSATGNMPILVFLPSSNQQGGAVDKAADERLEKVCYEFAKQAQGR